MLHTFLKTWQKYLEITLLLFASNKHTLSTHKYSEVRILHNAYFMYLLVICNHESVHDQHDIFNSKNIPTLNTNSNYYNIV